MAFIKAVLIVALLGGAALVIADWDRIFLLNRYEGRVVRVYQDLAGSADGRRDTEYMVEVETQNGVRTYEVPMQYFRELRPGVTVQKRFLSNRLTVSP